MCVQPGQFLIRTQQPVMTTDAGGSSRPVVVPITNPDEANAAFDAITYDKVHCTRRIRLTHTSEQEY